MTRRRLLTRVHQATLELRDLSELSFPLPSRYTPQCDSCLSCSSSERCIKLLTALNSGLESDNISFELDLEAPRSRQ